MIEKCVTTEIEGGMMIMCRALEIIGKEEKKLESTEFDAFTNESISPAVVSSKGHPGGL